MGKTELTTFLVTTLFKVTVVFFSGVFLLLENTPKTHPEKAKISTAPIID
ncbi:hypothetical protein N9P38_00610 [Flavobacteriales bacterium]|nr:hypothetical protein [Flavobacteriales bacterium]